MSPPPPTGCENIITSCGVGVQSECGQLDIVIMHRPGRELLRLTKDNLERLLYDAIPNINETHKSHDVFSQYLHDQGVHVLYVRELLRETLTSSDQACQRLIDGIVLNRSFKKDDQQQASKALRQWLLNRKPEQLVEDVIAGVAYSQDELGTSDHAQILAGTYDSINEFIIPPLPNLLFTRDAFSVIEKNVFIWRMAKPARQNEPLIFRVIFQHHPQLSTSGLKIIEWETTSNDYEVPTIEGGDVAYLGQGVLLIGCGERTNRAAIEALARTGLFRQVIAVLIPAQRDYMHLDTVLSSVGEHTFTLHGLLANIMKVLTVETHDDNNNIFAKPVWTSHGSNVCQALRELLNDSELVFYDAKDEITSINEQRDCRHNVLAIDDCHVVTYAGGDLEKGIVAQMTRYDSCHVGLIPTEGLLEGCGGMHCMTNAIRRLRR
jgi:arginine deiminase